MEVEERRSFQVDGSLIEGLCRDIIKPHWCQFFLVIFEIHALNCKPHERLNKSLNTSVGTIIHHLRRYQILT